MVEGRRFSNKIYCKLFGGGSFHAEVCMPKSTKLGWLVKIKLIQDLQLSEIWVGSFKS